MSYCTHCGRGNFTAKELKNWKQDEGFIEWCNHSSRGKKKLNPSKATAAWVKSYLEWERAWSDMGIPC